MTTTSVPPAVRASTVRVGLDVGGTKTDAVALDAHNSLVARIRLPTQPGAGGVLETVRTALRGLADQSATGDIRSIGIGIPGQVDPGGSVVRHAVNLGLQDLDLRELLESVTAAPVSLENDVKAAALGAYALRGAVDEALGYLNLGTGVAAGAVLNGELWRGSAGVAGEIGHLSIDPTGPRCACGQRGCIEAYAGGGAVARRWGGPGAGGVHEIFDAAEAGDRWAQHMRGEIAWAVASAVRVLTLSLDVSAVVLGGGVASLGDRLLGPVADVLEREATASHFLASLRLADRVETLPAGSLAAAFGAALVGQRPH